MILGGTPQKSRGIATVLRFDKKAEVIYYLNIFVIDVLSLTIYDID